MADIGTVYLIGAGPGDPGLITVRGRDRLQQADVVLYDRLIADELLTATRPGAELIDVGKSADHHKLSQVEINALLVEKAQAGLSVARLKGGDPFIFGRGGEEAQALAAAQVPFEVVPGITSPIAAPAYAGIPLTHRDVASNFAVVTGHRRSDGVSGDEGLGLDWQALARMDTLVVLMGVGNLPVIVGELLRAGRSKDTPAALIRWGTTSRQRAVTAPLASIAQKAEDKGIRPPAVLVIGEVVLLRDELAWFDTRPLFGLRVLITRPREKGRETAAKLRQLGAEPVLFPTIAIRPMEDASALDGSIDRLCDGAYDWTIFTSTNGVCFFWRRLIERGLDARIFAGTRLAAIGPITAGALEERGLHADLVPQQYVAEAILKEIGAVVGQRVLLPRADIARPDLAHGLRNAGADVDEVAAYRTVPADAGEAHRIRAELANGEIDVVTFTSSSTVRNLASAIGPLPELPGGTIVACIGPITAETASKHGLPVHVSAARYTIDGLLEAILDYISKRRTG